MLGTHLSIVDLRMFQHLQMRWNVCGMQKTSWVIQTNSHCSVLVGRSKIMTHKSIQNDRDNRYMRQALVLAERGLYSTKPNPRVGCVIVKDDTIVGEGWHSKFGGPHAEIVALEQAGAAARDAELYVSLEPCCHTGQTGPCVVALITAGVKRVVVGTIDPNPKVAGKGINCLQQSGIEVLSGVCESKARGLNPGFELRMRKGRPLVRVKIAATMDGRTAAKDGSSKWITSEEARKDVHHYRAQSCALVTGIGTVIHDNPRLNARVDGLVKQPLRVVLDGNARLEPNAELFSVDGPVLVVTSAQPVVNSSFDERTECIQLVGDDGRVDLGPLLTVLAEKNINEVIVEAGASVAGAFVTRDMVDEIIVYSSPDILGSSGQGMFVIDGISNIEDRIRFEIKNISRLGRDLRIIYSRSDDTD